MAGWWKKALIYLGLVEEEDDLEPLPEVHEPPQLETVRPIRADEPTAVRKIGVAAAPASSSGLSVSPVVTAPPARLHVIEPKSYGDAQEIGDKLKVDAPVIMNLQGVPAELASRLLAFASGLTYGLSGTMEKVADKVFLLSPSGVEVTVEERQRIISERGFFTQF